MSKPVMSQDPIVISYTQISRQTCMKTKNSGGPAQESESKYSGPCLSALPINEEKRTN